MRSTIALLLPERPRLSITYRTGEALIGRSGGLPPLDPPVAPGAKVHQAPQVEALILDPGQVAVPEVVDVVAVEEAPRRQRALEDLVLGPVGQLPAAPVRPLHAQAPLRT